MADYVRRPAKFLLRGFNVTEPGDRIQPEYAQVIRNLRCYRMGEWRQRPGLDLIADVDGGSTSSIFWLARINDVEAGTFRRMVATSAGNVYVDDATHTVYSAADSGYSSDPYTSVIARPNSSPDPYLFLANDQKQKKFTTLGSPSEWGLVAPLYPPKTELNGVVYTVIDDCDTSAGFSATNGVASTQNRVTTTVNSIVYDGPGTVPGFASIEPVTMAENFQEGMFVTFSGGITEQVIIEQVFQPISATTIAAINYDSGSTGPCTIQLATPTSGLERYSVIYLNATEYVLVRSVTLGLDGIPSLRCETVATFAAGDTVDGVRTFRAFLNSFHAAGENLAAGFVQIAIAGSGLATLAKSATLDLAIAGLGGPRPVQPEDFIHASFQVSDFSKLTEIQLQFDCDIGTNNFTRNYFFTSIRPPDLQAAYAQTSSSLTAQQQQIQRGQIDNFAQQELLKQKAALEARLAEPDLPYFPKVLAMKMLEDVNRQLGEGFNIGSDGGVLSAPGTGGSEQWTELKIPISNFQRVGSDTTRGWADVKAFQIAVQATDAVNIGLDDLWVGGTFGPNTQGLPGYNYVYVARNSQTGGMSNPSPPTRSPILPQRDRVRVVIEFGYSDPQADVLDIYRQGGTLAEYHLVGTTPINNLVFNDDIPDDIAVLNQSLAYDHFKPWPRQDRPKAGTCDVVGTQVIWKSGDKFNIQWVRGTQIIINQNVYTFYSYPSDDEHVQLNESGGALTDVEWEIPEATLDGQPLPYVFGPFGGGVSGEFVFAMGDPLNPGYLYWTNGNDPESASDADYLELCSPSEPLMNGCVLDGVNYAFSDRRSWRILPSFSGGQTGSGSDFYAQETSMGKGLASPWGLTVGDRIYFVAYEGIYASRGDVVESLTDDSLAPIFRRDGSSTTDTLVSGIVSQVSFDAADAKYISLTYSNDGLYFTYKGVDEFFYALYYGFLHQGWVLDTFSSNAVSIMRYLREQDGPGVDNIIAGSEDGGVFEFLATELSDSLSPINCYMRTREELWDEYRAQHQIADFMVDADPQGQAVTLGLTFDNLDSSLAITPDLTGSSRQQYVRDIEDGIGALKRSVALDLSWLGVNGITKIYGWEPAALIKPEFTFKRATDWTNGGYNGPKWLQGCRITGDTYNVAKLIQVQGDEGTLVSNLTITHNGESTKDYWWDPVVTHMMRVVGLDDNPWRDMGIEWIYEPEPPLAAIWHMQFSDLDSRGYLHIRDLLIAHRSSSNITLSLYWDDQAADSYTIGQSSGQRTKTYLPVLAKKGKLTALVFTATNPFALYLKDIEVRSKSWGVGGPYLVTKPFGDLTRTNLGARI